MLERLGYRQDLHHRGGVVDLVFYGWIFMVSIAACVIFGSVYRRTLLGAPGHWVRFNPARRYAAMLARWSGHG
jgi:hypothetical protein